MRRAVAGLKATQNLHRVTAFGLVDNDGMAPHSIEELESENVYPLPIFSVESMYYCAEVIEAIAVQQALTLGVNAEVLIAEAKAMSLAALMVQGVLEHLAARLAERQMREALMARIPDRAALKTLDALISIDILSTYPRELQTIRGLVSAGDLDGVIARYPVRESGVLAMLSKGMRFTGRADFERAALTRIGANAVLRQKLKEKLGRLASQLA